jgi:hypothetical protein
VVQPDSADDRVQVATMVLHHVVLELSKTVASVFPPPPSSPTGPATCSRPRERCREIRARARREAARGHGRWRICYELDDDGAAD